MEFPKSYLMVCKGGGSESFNRKTTFLIAGGGPGKERSGDILSCHGPIHQGNDILRDQLVGAMLYFLIMMIMAKVYGMLGGGFKDFFYFYPPFGEIIPIDSYYFSEVSEKTHQLGWLSLILIPNFILLLWSHESTSPSAFVNVATGIPKHRHVKS